MPSRPCLRGVAASGGGSEEGGRMDGERREAKRGRSRGSEKETLRLKEVEHTKTNSRELSP